MKFFKSEIFKLILKIAVSATLLYFIFRFIDLSTVLNEIENVNFYYLFVSVFLVIFLILFKAIRWGNIIKIFDTRIDLLSSIKYTIIAIGFALVTPSKIGEFIKAKYLRDKTKISYIKSFITVFIDKGFDLAAMLFLALLGLPLLKEFSEWSQIFIYGFVVYLVLIICAFIFFKDALKISAKIVPKKYREGFKKIDFTRAIYLKSFLFSLIIWAILSLQAFFILKSLGISVSLIVTMSVVPLMALSALVPISLGGIGVREIIAISFFMMMGIGAEKSAVFSLLYTFVGAGLPAIVGAFLHLLDKTK
jgi:glycosyltransferase 2 family protein